MKLETVIRDVYAKFIAINSKRKMRKVFKKAKKMTKDSGVYWYKDYDKTDSALIAGFAKSLRNRYKGLFNDKGEGKYLDLTNPTDILIQCLSDKYYDDAKKRQNLYNETLSDRRKFFNTKEQKEIAKLREQLIANKKAVHRIAFEPRPKDIEEINGRDALVVVLEEIGHEE